MKIKNSKSRRITASKSTSRRTRRYVRAAKDDYIKIGNMVLPKNAASYGNADYDTVQRDARKAYDEEVRKDAAAKAKADAEAAGKHLYDATVVAVETAGPDEALDAAFDELVPQSGKADTAAGELVRAMARLNYRYYNDGDKFYEGYGLETCAPSAAYLIDILPESTGIPDKLYSLAEGQISDAAYEAGLLVAIRNLIEYLLDTPELFGKPPKADSRDYASRTVNEIIELGHSYEYEIDTWGVAEAIDEGQISWEDFQYFLEDMCNDLGGDLNVWARDGFTIVNLTSDELSEWEEAFPRDIEEYVQELIEMREIAGEDEEY